MSNIKNLLKQLAKQETNLQNERFLAPCVKGGKVRTRMAKMIYTFSPRPADFEGWGIFKPQGIEVAKFVKKANFVQIDEYLQLFKVFRVRLLFKLEGATWLAYPVNESDARQRMGKVKPILVHLVKGGEALEQVVTRYDGAAFWFHENDRKADPFMTDDLREELKKEVLPEKLTLKNLTPEMRTAYSIAFKKTAVYLARKEAMKEENRLKNALKTGGGKLNKYQDKGDYWLVEWQTSNGAKHTSAITKNDLTVMSAGICLDGEDRKFDLQSLVGVVEGAFYY